MLSEQTHRLDIIGLGENLSRAKIKKMRFSEKKTRDGPATGSNLPAKTAYLLAASPKTGAAEFFSFLVTRNSGRAGLREAWGKKTGGSPVWNSG
jgi:hypothetical protein